MTQPGPDAPTHAAPHIATPRAGRDWINRASLTGVVLVVGALGVIRRTDATADEVAWIVGAALLAVGLVRMVLDRPRLRLAPRHLATSLVLVAGGGTLLVSEITSIRVLGQVVGALLAASGLIKLWRAFTARRSLPELGALGHAGDEALGPVAATGDTGGQDAPETADTAILARVLRPANVLLVEGLLLLVAAAVLAVVPEVLVSLLILVAAFSALGMGLILIAYGVDPATRAQAAGIDTMALAGIVRSWAAQRDVGPTRRDEVADTLFFEGPQKRARQSSFAVLMVLSTLIATFGVIQDSTAVVIGAMLVAPLMTPILGVAAGIIGAWPRRTAVSLATVAVGAALAVGVAVLASSWLPTELPLTGNSQITSRVTPTLLDLAIAVAAGAAGAYATIDKRVSSSLTGVAIAVALVPPLSVVGVTLHVGDWDSARGAGLLFATNAVAIVLTGSGVFLLSGFSSAARLRRYQDALRTSLFAFLVLGLVIVIPLSLAGQSLVLASARDARIEAAISTWLPDEPGWSLLSWNLADAELDVTVAGPSAAPDVELLDDAIEEATDSQVRVVLSLIPAQVSASGWSPEP